MAVRSLPTLDSKLFCYSESGDVGSGSKYELFPARFERKADAEGDKEPAGGAIERLQGCSAREPTGQGTRGHNQAEKPRERHCREDATEQSGVGATAISTGMNSRRNDT